MDNQYVHMYAVFVFHQSKIVEGEVIETYSQTSWKTRLSEKPSTTVKFVTRRHISGTGSLKTIRHSWKRYREGNTFKNINVAVKR